MLHCLLKLDERSRVVLWIWWNNGRKFRTRRKSRNKPSNIIGIHPLTFTEFPHLKHLFQELSVPESFTGKLRFHHLKWFYLLRTTCSTETIGHQLKWENLEVFCLMLCFTQTGVFTGICWVCWKLTFSRHSWIFTYYLLSHCSHLNSTSSAFSLPCLNSTSTTHTSKSAVLSQGRWPLKHDAGDTHADSEHC